jgi:structure-specific recognition protein 1
MLKSSFYISPPQLLAVAVRFYIPPDPDQDPADKSIPYPAELLQQKIMQTASIRKTTGDILVEFEQSKGTFLTPRGRYAIELYDWFLRLRGQKYDYKVCMCTML